jgi:hypothetical protein
MSSRPPPRAGPEAGARGGELNTVRQEDISQQDHRDDAEKLLDDLGDRRRRHHLQALEITAVARQHRHEENGRRQRGDRVIRSRVANVLILYEPGSAKPQ